MATDAGLRERLSPLDAAALKARMMDYPHWTADETAVYLGVSRQRINELVHERKLRRLKISKGGVFSRDQVLEFLESVG
jgi:excisionase family DNA binding protein